MSDQLERLNGIRMNKEDLQFLESLGLVGVLDLNDVLEYYPNHKPNSVQRRLRIMTSNKVIRATRLLVSFEESSKSGRLPLLYSLTEKGADFLESSTGQRPARYLTGEPAASTFFHRRDVAKVVSTFTKFAVMAGLDEPKWILEQDCWHAAPKTLPPNQRLLLYHQFDTPFAVCKPDAACHFKMNDRDVVLFFEIDRSTEGSKSVADEKRLLGYQQLFHFREYDRYFSNTESPFVCLIWICLSTARIKSLQKLFAGKPLANHMRFATLEPFLVKADVLCTPIFQTIDGEYRRIYKPKNMP